MKSSNTDQIYIYVPNKNYFVYRCHCKGKTPKEVVCTYNIHIINLQYITRLINKYNLYIQYNIILYYIDD